MIKGTGRIAALALLVAAGAVHAAPMTMTTGAGWVAVGADHTTGKLNRCGLEIRGMEMSASSEKPPKSLADVSAAGIIGSVMVNINDDGSLYGATKMAMTNKPTGKTEPIIQSINTWWLKPVGKNAAVIAGKVVPADNAPYKLAGMSTDNVMNVLFAIAKGESLKVYFEPTAQGGAVTFDVVFEVQKEDKLKMIDCIEEMVKGTGR